MVAWAVAAPWLLWAVIRGFGLESGFPLVPLMAFTPYMAIAAVVPFAIALFLRSWGAAILVALAGLLLAFGVLPRMIGGPEDERTGDVTLRVVSANIYRGRADVEKLMDIAREMHANVLCILELTPDAMARLEAAGIREEFPYRERVAGEEFGGGIFSQYPLRALPPIVAGPRLKVAGPPLSFPRARVLIPGAVRTEVIAAHPLAPTQRRVGDWEMGLKALPSAGEGPLKLLIGDFNATFDHEAFRNLIDSGYRDAGAVMGEGLRPTWKAGSIIPPPVTIDHVLADRRVNIGAYDVHDLPGSDHEALSATLFLPPPGGYGD